MYTFLASFTVQPEHRSDFVEVALKTGRDSLANEPGSKAFTVVADEADPNRFYLNETYADEAAFQAHAEGAYFKAFFAEASQYAEGPTWLMRGNVLSQPA
ncbi:antibiotic biosynthesis monooxygenase [Streptomyces parvulus]|uniref:putative quinol monooxygenase n=1 Tax=Streptomyces parvulus TaxID=146923 RepID=UPI001E400023|nr:putative quinol monooxygenase [Streptomyces parvulus]MCC9157902.1 antibiotic biosynthesis monooxygenase [Streptomyces parvulus]MCE7690210.1 antibiotic biosynthesis monooxygenase [Streptomyces parvulus]